MDAERLDSQTVKAIKGSLQWFIFIFEGRAFRD